MKKILLLSFILSFLLLSCSEDELMTYDGIDGIYFMPKQEMGAAHFKEYYYDSLEFSFGLILAESVTQRLKVRAFGQMKNFDRVFKAKVDSTSLKPGQFEMSEDNTFPANQYTGYLPITFHRHSDWDNDTAYFVVSLIPSNHFEPVMPNNIKYNTSTGLPTDTVPIITFRIKVTNVIPKPGYWMYAFMPNMNEYFSYDKMAWISELMGFEISDWYMSMGSGPLANKVFGIGNYTKNVLNTLIDDDRRDDYPRDRYAPAANKGYITVPGVTIPDSWPHGLNP